MDLSQSNTYQFAIKYGLQHVSDASLPPKLEDIKKQLQEEIEKELKIKEGAENLKKLISDEESLSSVQLIVDKANTKLQKQQQDLREVNEYILIIQHQSSDLNFNVPGICGLQNFENSGYFNAGLQCLLSNKFIKDFFYDKDLDSFKGTLTFKFAEVVKRVWSGNFSTLHPQDFKDCFKAMHAQFRNLDQQDCQDFLLLLLGTMHEELNKEKKESSTLFKESLTISNKEHLSDSDSYSSDSSSELDITDDNRLLTQIYKRLNIINKENNSSFSLEFEKKGENEVNILGNIPGLKVKESGGKRINKANLMHEKMKVHKSNFEGLTFSQFDENMEKNDHNINDFLDREDSRDQCAEGSSQFGESSPTCQGLSLYDEEEQALSCWNAYISTNNSVIVDTFQGQLRSSVVCSQCSHNSINFEPFTFLSLNLPHVLEQQIVVTVCRNNGTSPVCYLITLKKDDLICKIREGLEIVLDTVIEEMIIAEVFEHHILRILNDDACIESLNNTSTSVYVFEVSHMTKRKSAESHHPEIPSRTIQILMRNDSFENGDEKTVILGHPRLLRLASTLPASQLYENIQNIFDIESFPTYSLLFVDEHGKYCSRCLDSMSCSGCVISRSGFINLKPGDNIAVRFSGLPSEFLNLAAEVIQHKSMQQKRRNLDINECLKYFSERESLESSWFCPVCNENQKATKSLSVWKFPEVLIICLKRFVFHDFVSIKIKDKVAYPIDGLDLSPFCCGPFTGDLIYDLQACVCHFGNFNGGHYTSYTKHMLTKDWYYLNDDNVHKKHPSSDESGHQYILFYQKR